MSGVLGTTTAACSPYELQTQRRRPARPTPTRAEAPAVDPDVTLATTVVAAERALLERVELTLSRHPRLERLLVPTRTVHEAHVSLLQDAVPEDAGRAGATGSAAPSDGADVAADPSAGEPEGPAVPRDPARALRVVAAAEDDLALAAKQAAFAAQSGAFARVLASMAAAAAQQSAVLRSARVAGGRR